MLKQEFKQCVKVAQFLKPAGIELMMVCGNPKCGELLPIYQHKDTGLFAMQCECSQWTVRG